MTATRRVCFCLLFALAFPLFGKAQDYATLQFGTISKLTVLSTSSFEGYFGNNPVYLNSTTPSGPFSIIEVQPGTLNPSNRPTIWVQFTPPYNAGTYSGTVYANFSNQYNEHYTAAVNVSVTYNPFTGFVNPKYLIVGVWYSAPGSPSKVCYGSDTVVGNSTMVGNSFSDSVTKSVSLSGTGKIPGVTTTITDTFSNTYTQETDTSESVAVSQTTSNSQCLGAFSGVSFAGLNHDWDEVFVWLNPIATFNVSTDYSSVLWTGFGWDENDPTYPDLDIFGVPVGCLNGDFQTTNPAEWSTCQSYFQCPSGPLARCWAQNNVDGSGPGLTGFGTSCNPAPNPMTDLCNILTADQFGNSSFTFTPPPQGSFTTPDGRFTACDATHSNCNTIIQYSPGNGNTYNQGYTLTQTQSQTFKDTYSTTYSVESKFEGTSFLSGFSADLKTSTTMTWINQFNQSTNNSQGQTASFNIVGPSPGYTGPSEFVLYQDNLYGTFMFNAQ